MKKYLYILLFLGVLDTMFMAIPKSDKGYDLFLLSDHLVPIPWYIFLLSQKVISLLVAYLLWFTNDKYEVSFRAWYLVQWFFLIVFILHYDTIFWTYKGYEFSLKVFAYFYLAYAIYNDEK